MNISIIGLGLIGGSFGLALKEHTDFRIRGWDINQKNLKKAKELGIVDEIESTLDGVIPNADLIVLAIPVDQIEELLPSILDKIEQHQFVVDFGSTKAAICRNVKDHTNRNRFLAAHPIAGTEYSGPEAAFLGLYKDKMMILCDPDFSDGGIVEQFKMICSSIGMNCIELSSEDHDKHLAYVSHLSHVIAFGLSNTVLEIEKEDNRILELAGSGFASTVRLAKSDPAMWVPIFLKNREHVLEGLNRYLKDMKNFKDFLESENEQELTKFLESGRKIRKILG